MIARYTPYFLLSFVLICALSSCKVYRQDIMFQVNDAAELEKSLYVSDRNYLLAPNDWLKINVYPNNGEQMIDPNFEPLNNFQQGGIFQMQMINQFQYLIQSDGRAKLPIIGDVVLGGLTIDEAEDKIEALYSIHFNDAFVKLQYINKRVIVLSQKSSMVIPLLNENMSLIEVIALAGGLKFGDKAQNIRIIRGELSQPKVFEINLATIEGMKSSAIHVQPGDIVYIEPWRRPWQEALRDISPVIGIATSFSTLVFLIINVM